MSEGLGQGNPILVTNRSRAGSTPAVTLTRPQLIKKVFELCDIDRDGVLDAQEAFTFALMNGFEGTNNEWFLEFASLCNEYSTSPHRGVDLEMVASLADGDLDRGGYCSDKELRDIVAMVEAMQPPPKPWPPPAAFSAAPVQPVRLAMPHTSASPRSLQDPADTMRTPHHSPLALELSAFAETQPVDLLLKLVPRQSAKPCLAMPSRRRRSPTSPPDGHRRGPAHRKRCRNPQAPNVDSRRHCSPHRD